MNYIFNILWFEDNSGWFKLQNPKVTNIVGEHCLECHITHNKNSDLRLQELNSTKYDLILMDFDLASKKSGVDVISAIREQNVLTDILFYSSQYDNMISAVSSISPPLDGIYYSNRKSEEFEQKFSRVISKIVQRSEDLINLRGFVLDNTCDFELRIREILTICWNKFPPAEKELLCEKMQEQLEAKCRRTKKSVKTAQEQPCIFSYANQDEHLLSVSDRLDIMNAILPILITKYNMPSIKEIEDFKKYYINTVNVYRNRLGHVKLGEGVLHINGKDLPIDQSLHRMLRKNISAVDKILLSIEKYVATQI